LDLLKRLEGSIKRGNVHVPYSDQTSKPIQSFVKGATIGYGHLIQTKQEFAKYKCGISEEAATELLKKNVQTAVAQVRKTNKANINQNQFDALILLCYNIGVGRFARSDVVKMINNPKYKSRQFKTTEAAWKAYVYSRGKRRLGLVRRRNAEWALYTKQ